MKAPLSAVNEMLPWKQWTVVVSVVSSSFMAGVMTAALPHIANTDIHPTPTMRMQENEMVRERQQELLLRMALAERDAALQKTEIAQLRLETDTWMAKIVDSLREIRERVDRLR